jgi:hypothetical protein
MSCIIVKGQKIPLKSIRLGCGQRTVSCAEPLGPAGLAESQYGPLKHCSRSEVLTYKNEKPLSRMQETLRIKHLYVVLCPKGKNHGSGNQLVVTVTPCDPSGAFSLPILVIAVFLKIEISDSQREISCQGCGKRLVELHITVFPGYFRVARKQNDSHF